MIGARAELHLDTATAPKQRVLLAPEEHTR